MRVFLTGANGVMGHAATSALIRAGHDVVGLVRREDAAELVRAWGAEPVYGDVFHHDELARHMAGCDAVLNFATHIPIGAGALRPGSLRAVNDIRERGAGIVADAAIEAGVGRMVQQSLSFVYVDSGDRTVDESTPVDVTSVTEPVVVAEDHARRVESAGGTAVNLRYGLIVGPDRNTAWLLRRARAGRSIGLGAPDDWMHVIHPDDVGSSALLALGAPGGTYNVGAEPLRRRDYVDIIGRAAGREDVGFMPGWVMRMANVKLELLTRSHRVSSELFSRVTGWEPLRPAMGEDWIDG